jgi:hypothetical protein
MTKKLWITISIPPHHWVRLLKGDDMTPVKSIRLYCLDCCGNSPKEVRLCPCTDCTLYPFRLGKNPNKTGKKKNHTAKNVTAENTIVDSPISTAEIKEEGNG